MKVEIIIACIVIAIILLVVLIGLTRKIRIRKLLETVTSVNRGTISERKLVLELLKWGVPAQTIFHDLCVEKINGKFSQIDVVIATTEGIVVIEVKEYSGWIFGNGNHSNWTQVLAYGKQKYRFYNPIKQNKNHINSLRSQLKQFENVPFYSIILFYGNCELREIDFVPEGTYLVKSHRIFEVLDLIREDNEPAPYTNKKEVVKVLKQAVSNGGNEQNQEEHIDNINDMLGKNRIFD